MFARHHAALVAQPAPGTLRRATIAGLVWCGLMLGCQPARTLDQQGYAFAQALYGICSRQDEARLQQFVGQLEDAARTGAVTAGEYRQLQPALERAQRGEWQAARESIHQLLQRQVLRSS
jgi:hypothetical protein